MSWQQVVRDIGLAVVAGATTVLVVWILVGHPTVNAFLRCQ